MSRFLSPSPTVSRGLDGEPGSSGRSQLMNLRPVALSHPIRIGVNRSRCPGAL